MFRRTRESPRSSCTSSNFRRLLDGAKDPPVHECVGWRIGWHDYALHGLLLSASTPGSFSPARNSNEAPPPVEMCEIWDARPDCSTAATESPPPTIDVAPVPA